MYTLDDNEQLFVELAFQAVKGSREDWIAFLDNIDPTLLCSMFSLGGCMPAQTASDACALPRRESVHSPGLKFGESAWGDKRERRDSIVAQNHDRAISEADRRKLVAYRRNLVETTGQATLGDDQQENWQALVDIL